MFVSQQFSQLIQLFYGGQHAEEGLESPFLKSHVGNAVTDISASLLQAKQDRQQQRSEGVYIIQSAIDDRSSNLAFLFAPLILANLNRATIYSTQITAPVSTILSPHYSLESALQLDIDKALDALNLHMHMMDADLDPSEFLITQIIQALMRADLRSLILIVDQDVDRNRLKDLADFFQINITVISSNDSPEIVPSAEISMHQLLFKRKDETHTQLTRLFSQRLAPVVSFVVGLTEAQSTLLIEDMFYAEHIFEKLSVYAEYVQTQIQYKENKPRRLFAS
ncbi:hypothetical protein SAMN05421749_10325 [Acinetobacter marinus]|uniref:Uncharacterized protein n=1 Tax=Acinetobacter marinus TaxID=281375 RepID=A0A1G6IFR1_9GAMM|nr:hypothetical protein [Acinetobacter marinus]SDC05240.1 hypothetical protein SAMN05421749_10325 [Acinetobacter marinus]